MTGQARLGPVAAGLAVAGLLLGSGAPARAQGTPAPAYAQPGGLGAGLPADGPVAWVDREPLRYDAVLAGGETQRPGLFGGTPGVPPRLGATQRLRVGLYAPDAQGHVTGTAVLLDGQGTLLASGDVRGTQHGSSCRLRLGLGDAVAMLQGACTPAALSGDFVVRVPARRFSLVRLLLAKAGGNSVGEAWLQAE